MSTRRFIILSVAASLLLGGAWAMVLGMAAPRWLPKNPSHYYAQGMNSSYVSWCMRSYHVCPNAPLPSGREAAKLARSMPFTPDFHHQEFLRERLIIDFPSFPGGTCDVIDAGFPFRCVSGWSYRAPTFIERRDGLLQENPHFPSLAERESGYIELPARGRVRDPDTGWVPYSPLWPGLIGNAVVWGSVIWIGVFGVRLARQGMRRRHGRCVHCGYDRAGLPPTTPPTPPPPCPECGRPP